MKISEDAGLPFLDCFTCDSHILRSICWCYDAIVIFELFGTHSGDILPGVSTSDLEAVLRLRITHAFMQLSVMSPFCCSSTILPPFLDKIFFVGKDLKKRSSYN